jgi:F-type H+-transporting ATPase subunit gamma
MASLKDLRNRIASVKATQKITKAMQMVAAAKLRRAQEAPRRRAPMPSAWTRCSPTSRPRCRPRRRAALLAGTGKRPGAPAGRLHRRARPCGASTPRSRGSRASTCRARLMPRARRSRSSASASKGYGHPAPRLRRQIVERVDCATCASSASPRRRGRPRRSGAVRGRRVRRLHAVLLPLQVGDQPDPTAQQLIPAADRRRRRRGREAAVRSTSTSPTRRRSSPTCCRATSRCRSSARCSRTPPASRAPDDAMDNATRNAGDMINKLTLSTTARARRITKELIEIISGAEAL